MVKPASQNNTNIRVFDRSCVKHNRNRSLKDFKNHGFLFDWAADQINDRLSDVNRNFPKVLQLGIRGPAIQNDKIQSQFTMDIAGTPSIIAEEDILPIAPGSLDLITGNLTLQTVNDLPGALIQIRRALKPDGLFLAAMLGGETLHEFRHVLSETEIEMHGGISPRVAPFADKQQMGGLMQRAGFALPVIDSELITVTYDSMFKLMHDLRGMGETNAITERNRKPLGKRFFMRAAEKYQKEFSEGDGRIVATFEIIFLLGWAPHDSQQKPLRPGSAEHSLAEALNTKEISTGEKAKP